MTKITKISVTERGMSDGTPCHIRGKRQTTSQGSFKERAVTGRTQAAKVRGNWDDRSRNTSYCWDGSLSKAQRTNRIPVQILVTFWIVAHPWPATSRKRVFAPVEDKIIMILPGIETPIPLPFSLISVSVS